MKISNLHIDSYRQLQNLDFDFCYPEGHKNAGKPLHKICLIGQSATGKTTILELLKNNIGPLGEAKTVADKYLFSNYRLGFSGSIESRDEKNVYLLQEKTIIKNGKAFENNYNAGGAIGKILQNGLRVLYLSSELISSDSIKIFDQNPTNILNDLANEKFTDLNNKFTQNSYNYEFSNNMNEELWFSLLYKILQYRKKFTQMASELINKGAIGDLQRLNAKYQEWSKLNENPLIPFSKYFNPILEKLRLSVDLINTEFPIPIKSETTNEIIPISGLSTGTKGLLLAMFPLSELNTDNGIIFIDEPERSLFPDIQIDLVSHYERLAPNSQLIIATHSPFIAASFEPEERFILYFNNNGKVALRRGVSPIGDDPNDVLGNDFQVNYYNKFGIEAYEKYLELKSRASKETNPETKKKLIKEAVALGDKYNF